ncbi:MAG: HEAT repeat domain-containing protein [Bryobacterales bacterium]|nr:HEAT repeat domain-containing protein [Bryobacterales bacterium]
MAQQSTGNTQASPEAAAPKPAPPKPNPLPAIPPELDALPIWKLGAPALVAMLKDPKSTVFQKAIACKKLSIVGGKDAIAPMAALLSDPKLSCYARFGMEPNPDPSVDDAFRAALPKLTGKLQIGVINSIGFRRDAKAVDALAKLIDNSDPEIGRAAAASLGMIGGEQATRALQTALGRPQSPVFPVAARAMLLCAEGAIATDRARGLQLYQELSATTMPKPVRLTALRVLNGAGPAPEYTNRWPAPTGEAARQDKSGFLGRNP